MFSSVRLGCVLALSLALGCGEATPPEDGGGGSGAVGGAGGTGGFGGTPECESPSDCDDSNPCTDDLCHAADGRCVHTPLADGTECPFGEHRGHCASGTCVGLCEGIDCNDDNECTEDLCDPKSGQCTNAFVPDGTQCEFDGFPGVCTSGVCEDAELCRDKDCSDGNACTDDVCDRLTGNCSNPNKVDGAVCQIDEYPGRCARGQCVGLCQGVDCSDGNECTDDTCNPLTGGCPHLPVKDGTTCQVGQDPGRCSSGVCVGLCEGVDCDDGNECTSDACNPANGKCVYTDRPDGAACTGGICLDGVCAIGADLVYPLRMGYIIPADRTPQPESEADMQAYLVRIQDWYREHMTRQDFGPKTFRFETEADGVSPKVNFCYDSTVTAAYLRADDVPESQKIGTQIERLRESMANCGYPGIGWQENEAWILLAESHIEFPDGTVNAGPYRGSTGGRDHGGEAYVSSNLIFRLNLPFLTDDHDYDGRVFPALGPYPTVYPDTFPGEGETISNISSAAQGGIAHEAGHAFGLMHQPRNGRNLMGGGLRDFRSAIFPDLYPDDDCRLAYGSALLLSYTRYFNPDETYTENQRPLLDILTPAGNIDPVNGLLEIAFHAEDASGIVAAFLRTGIDEWAALPLEGSAVDETFRIPFYRPGETVEYQVIVMDAQGNKTTKSVVLIVNPGFNQAPMPRVNLPNSYIKKDVAVTLNVLQQPGFDPDPDWPQITVEWDMDGDGIFDTPPTVQKELNWTYKQPGIYRVVARLTDPQGAAALSSPIGVRVYDPVADSAVVFFAQPELDRRHK